MKQLGRDQQRVSRVEVVGPILQLKAAGALLDAAELIIGMVMMGGHDVAALPLLPVDVDAVDIPQNRPFYPGHRGLLCWKISKS